ncbi:MAG: hypothetical protein JWP95_1592, partial [Actinotalea sp.]|nr:hypothetical protein [Actinotalea sp.]
GTAVLGERLSAAGVVGAVLILVGLLVQSRGSGARPLRRPSR